MGHYAARAFSACELSERGARVRKVHVVTAPADSVHRGARGRYSRSMAVDRTRTLRGALAGATAAAVWAAQQPLDQRVFGVEYDDVELLGRFVTDGPAAYPIGLALHMANGAVFGAVYANAARGLPIPAACAGRSRASRSTSRRGPEPPRCRACIRPPVRCRSCGAPAAHSRKRPGATCCSGRCWANSSGGSTRPTPSPPDRSRRGGVKRARVGRIPGVAQLSRAFITARAASPAVTSSPPARPMATSSRRAALLPRRSPRRGRARARRRRPAGRRLPPRRARPRRPSRGRTRSARSPTTSR